jgi:site-specific DNA-methyltransferase (adenine-specific)/modification methylase
MQIDDFKNKIIAGNCIESLKKLPENSVDLIFADPPYNLQLSGELYRPNQTKVSAVNDEWDKFDSFKAYDIFCEQWLAECFRVLKKNGCIWVIGTYHNIFRVGTIMQNIGFWMLNDIIWIKQNPMPNFKGTRFNNAHETMIWATKSNTSKFTFHYKAMKTYNDDLQMRSDWNIPICSGSERIKTEGQKAHSTQKPEELLQRIILSTSNVNDVVLDPFFGSGTTGAVAKKLQRHFIGLEQEKKYIKVATERIKNIVPLDLSLLNYNTEIKPPRVPFSSLIEKNILNIGDYIYSKDKKIKAQIQADTSLQYNNIAGSIHKVSASILNKESNNGWEYWYVVQAKKLICINELRQDYIKKYLTK